MNSFWTTSIWRISMKNFSLLSNCSLLSFNWVLSLILRPTVSRSVRLGIKHPSGAYDQILITVRQLRIYWRGALYLWREDGFVDYNCCWPSPALSFSYPSPVGLATIFYCLRFETSLFVASYDSQGYGGGTRPHLHTGLTRSSPLIQESTAFYNFHAAEIEVTISNSSCYSVFPLPRNVCQISWQRFDSCKRIRCCRNRCQLTVA
jgi:hypothetical protein